MDSARNRWLALANERVQGAGLRSGAVRTALIEFLAREGQCFLTAQEMIDELRKGGVGSPASVYRVLDELFDLGLLNRMDGHDGLARFPEMQVDDQLHPEPVI